MATQHLVEAGYCCLGGCPELLSGPWTGPGAWYTEDSPLDIPPDYFPSPLPFCLLCPPSLEERHAHLLPARSLADRAARPAYVAARVCRTQTLSAMCGISVEAISVAGADYDADR